MIEKTIKNLNCNGAYCYGIKLVIRLIDHYGYNRDEWHEVLDILCERTTFKGNDHERHRTWIKNIEYCSPTSALEPIVIQDPKAAQNFFPCDDDCENPCWIFSEYGDEGTFCTNFTNCKYVKDHYRYTRQADDNPGKNQYAEGKYREYYDLYMRTDINLLRIIEETLQIAYGDLAFEYFDGDHMPVLYDMINAFEALGLPLPDCDDIPDEGFGEENRKCCFDCSHLI